MGIGKWDYIKLKGLCTAKEKSQQNEKTIFGRKYLQTTHLIRVTITEIIERHSYDLIATNNQN